MAALEESTCSRRVGGPKGPGTSPPIRYRTRSWTAIPDPGFRKEGGLSRPPQTGLVVGGGEITRSCYVDIPKGPRETIREVGLNPRKYGFDYETCGVITGASTSSRGDMSDGAWTSSGAGATRAHVWVAVHRRTEEADAAGPHSGWPTSFCQAAPPFPTHVRRAVETATSAGRQELSLRYATSTARPVGVEDGGSSHAARPDTEGSSKIAREDDRGDRGCRPSPSTCFDPKRITSHIQIPPGRVASNGAFPWADTGLTGARS